MRNNIKNYKEQGFTIIEVMIVLAIAGLIMIVVFLAVPALQRSGRNNALSTSTSNVLSSVGEFVTNNGGQLPVTQAAAAPSGGEYTIGTSTQNQTKAKVENGVATVQIGGTAITNAAAVGTVQVVTGTTGVCNPSGTGLGSGASNRSYAVLYVAESSSGKVLRCVGN